jgi:DNA-binding winged helix-turn-helix (wHTH) protein/tetratricopeptide (TPR) repeat protein
MNDSRSTSDVFPLRADSGSAPSRYDPRSLAKRPDFRLEDAIVRPSIRTVEGPDGKATVEPRVMQVLVALVEAEGGVLTREDLIRHCWNGQIVGDDAINRAIAEVRRIARNTGGGFGVETIPRIGYRLEGTKTEIGAPESADTDPAAEGPFRAPGAPRRAVIAGGFALAAGGLAYWLARPTSVDPAEALINESRIAMLAGTKEGEAKALELLDRAVAVSPGSATAWGRLALYRARIDEHGVNYASIPLSKIEEAASRALELDPRNADAKAARALAVPYYGDWFNAERRFRSVLEAHPGHIETVDSLSFFLGAVGRMRDSARERQAIAETAPPSPDFQFRNAYGHWFLGQTVQADQIVTSGLEMWPRHMGLWLARLWLLAGTDRLDRAILHLDDAERRPPMLPPPTIAMMRNSLVAAQSGNSDQIARASQSVLAGASRNVATVVSGMMLLNLMRANDAAFALADAYYLERGPVMAATASRPGQPSGPDQRRRKTNMLFTPVAATMQQDSRFLPLMEQMGLADYWRRIGVKPDFLTSTRA